jgi:hypothetical protein
MGDAFTRIKVPAKCAARLGQCFSTTVDAARVDKQQLVSTMLVTGGWTMNLWWFRQLSPSRRTRVQRFLCQ